MDQIIAQAIKRLSEGKLICFPSETVYALAADATNSYAVQEVYKIKGRTQHSPLSLMVADIKTARQYVIFNAQAEKLAALFWPGPLTLVLPIHTTTQNSLSSYVNEGSKTLGIRIPNHPVAQQILQTFGKPIVATSVNPTGKPSATSVEEVHEYFKDELFTVPGEKSSLSLASTVVDMSTASPTILRIGSISKEEILKACAGL
jgi:L-threonylcarbamoyladenylate synthase